MRILCGAVVPLLSPPLFDPYLSMPGVNNALSCLLSVTPLLTHVCSSYQDPLFQACSPLASSKFQLRVVNDKWTHVVPFPNGDFQEREATVAQQSGERDRGAILVEC